MKIERVETAWIRMPLPRQHVAWPDLFPGYPPVRDGRMWIRDEPGWGMTVNDELIERRGVKVRWEW